MKRSGSLSLLICLIVAVFMFGSYAQAQESLLGIEFAFTAGGQSGPFETGAGPSFSGEIGLPIKKVGPGVFMGLISIGYAKTEEDTTFEPTINALHPGALPTIENVELSTLTIIIGFKYKLQASDIFQPYIMFGPGFNIFLNETDPSTPGGIAPQPVELQDKGFPAGQGNIMFGIHAGGGIDINLHKQFFLGAEVRYNYVDNQNGSFATYGGRAGFRF